MHKTGRLVSKAQLWKVVPRHPPPRPLEAIDLGVLTCKLPVEQILVLLILVLQLISLRFLVRQSCPKNEPFVSSSPLAPPLSCSRVVERIIGLVLLLLLFQRGHYSRPRGGGSSSFNATPPTHTHTLRPIKLSCRVVSGQACQPLLADSSHALRRATFGACLPARANPAWVSGLSYSPMGVPKVWV